jgi:hypothetical protein
MFSDLPRYLIYLCVSYASKIKGRAITMPATATPLIADLAGIDLAALDDILLQ